MTMSFYLNGGSGNKCLIMFKIYDSQFPGRRFVYSSKEYIEPRIWDEKRGRAKKEFESLNLRLDEIESAARAFIVTNRKTLTKAALKAHLDGLRPKEAKVAKGRDLISHWTDWLLTLKGNITNGTWRNYQKSCATFKRFLADRQFARSRQQTYSLELTPTEFTQSIFQSYLVWLKSVQLENRQGIAKQTGYKQSTLARRVKHLKMCLDHLQSIREISGELDFSYVRAKEPTGLKFRMTEEELITMARFKFDGRLERVRDLFVLQCSVGLRISDFFRLEKNITGNKIIIVQKKTHKEIEIPITLLAREILEKYSFRLPKMSEQKYRKGIKDVYRNIFPNATVQVRKGDKFDNVPAWTKIRSHDAIRTFVNISHARGMNLNSIALITGKSMKVLQDNYLCEDQLTAEIQMRNAWDSLATGIEMRIVA